jgi:hypothetical protein
MALYTRHSLLFQTAFSELKRHAAEQPFAFVGTPGSVGEREVNGRRFYYRQYYDAQGKKRAEYIGPVGAAKSNARARSTRRAIDRTNALVKEARVLGQQGYVRVDPRAGAILASLANHGVFRAGAVLIGSHAYGALLNELGVRAAAFLTEDVDIARGRPLEIALERDGSFARMLADSSIALFPVPGFDRKAPATSFKAKGADRLRVDLLVPAEGRDVTTREVPELRAFATALPYLAYLLHDPIDGVVFGREGAVILKVPRPELFTWHKMLASQLRDETREKRSKDIRQAATLFAVLVEDAPDALEAAFEALPRGGMTKTRAAARQVLTLLEGGEHERAAAALRQFL